MFFCDKKDSDACGVYVWLGNLIQPFKPTREYIA